MGSKAGTQQQTAQELALAQHAQAQLKDYKQRWLPVQQKLASTIEQEGAPNSAARRLAEGKSSTDTAMAFDKANNDLQSGLSNSGVLPGSSRSNLAVTGLGTNEAASTGLGKLMSDQQIDDAYTQGLGALTALGRGERAEVGNSMTGMAKASSAQAQADAQAALMEQSGNAKLGAQVVGFGLQQGFQKSGTKNAFNGSNDFAGVNGNNAMDTWLKSGVGGD